MQIAIVGILSYLVIIIIHAFWYLSKENHRDYLIQKNHAACYLGKYRKELNNVKALRQQEFILKMEIEKLNQHIPAPISRIDYPLHFKEDRYKVLDVDCGVEIDLFMIQRMHFNDEANFIKRQKMQITQDISMELLRSGAIKFTERVNYNNKIIKGLVKVLVPDN